MIKKFISLWDENKESLREYFKTTKQENYSSYLDLVKLVVEKIVNLGETRYDTDKITVVDDGDYQGTQLFIIPEDTYQPSVEEYIYTNTYYGSCSGCDTLEGISGYEDGLPKDDQIEDYMTLCMHLIQKFKRLGN